MSNPFSIFKQSTNSFEGEEQGEEVVLLLRRHPFVILIQLFFYLVLCLVPIVVGTIFSDTINSYHIYNLYLFISAIIYLLLWQAIFYSLTMYTLDVWIVTNKRVIDNTQHGFFNRTVSELHMSRIQDISVNTSGFLPTLLHYGDLHIQTAGTEERFKFMQVPHPEKAKDEIMRLAGAHRSSHIEH